LNIEVRDRIAAVIAEVLLVYGRHLTVLSDCDVFAAVCRARVSTL